ncbi:hypothetical protein CDL15_Pgr018918 [Punica granatum]|uniref:Uncharacterized protein n=1 Tax=Punica granatum TaxID=22663 RepID=A0A218WN01_PUNGR|nr:hypothetical protein CDL15_Pgr018918 [Punica granatum]PKI66799.1 hypothetical protein CRG98_012805 [Punica granatum]
MWKPSWLRPFGLLTMYERFDVVEWEELRIFYRFGFSRTLGRSAHLTLFSYITDKRSLVTRLLQVFQPSDRDYTDWKQFMEGLTPTQFLWAACWNPGGSLTIGCPSVIGLPLISHLGSTLVFSARVIRQLDGLQDIPIEVDHTPYCFM